MPRNMSFFLTTPQFKARSKDVTRRFAWWKLKPGDVVMGVEKSQGLKKGEKIKRLGLIRIVSVTVEPADAILSYPPDEVAREGFPDMPPADFLAMLCTANRKQPNEPVNRIEYEYIDHA
jgi:hypothetical protein